MAVDTEADMVVATMVVAAILVVILVVMASATRMVAAGIMVGCGS